MQLIKKYLRSKQFLSILSSILIIFIIAIIVTLYFMFTSKTTLNSKIVTTNKLYSNQPTVFESKNVNSITPSIESSNIINLKSFVDNFEYFQILNETGNMSESANKNWWLNSGGYLYINNNIAKSIQGDLDANDKERLLYYKNNPEETDNGYHPQNILRLVTTSKWKDYEQEVYFKINKYILSNSIHRIESNGILLFNRYQDGNNLYYAGLRVDGNAVIKKKIDKIYYQMGLKKIINGTYDIKSNPNLLPLNTLIGVKTSVITVTQNNVQISLYIDIGKTGKWNQVLSEIDDNRSFGGNSIVTDGYAGIRTDFMDVEFSNYSIKEL